MSQLRCLSPRFRITAFILDVLLVTPIVTFSLETALDGSMLLDKEILNWPPEHREIKINHQGVCVQIVLKILWKLYITKCFFFSCENVKLYFSMENNFPQVSFSMLSKSSSHRKLTPRTKARVLKITFVLFHWMWSFKNDFKNLLIDKNNSWKRAHRT